MVDPTPQFFDVAVDGGAMRVARFGSGDRIVLGLHGITGSCMQLVPVVRHLGAPFTLMAPDLRGRGASNDLPGPYGMIAHADDTAAVLRSVTDGPAVVVGESMGAYVAVVLAARHPDLVSSVVLADGGLPLPVPPGLDPDVVLDAVLGPALARLRQVFASRQAYLDFWRAHPAVGEDWNDDVEAYLDYDLEATDGGWRSRAREEAVRVDGGQHVVEPTLIEEHLRRVSCPLALIRAPRNLLNQAMPLLPDDAVATWQQVLPQLSDAMVDDTNHYTLMLGVRGAARIAELVERAP